MPANAPHANSAVAATSSQNAAVDAPATPSTTTTSSSAAVMPAPKRGPRGSMPAGRVSAPTCCSVLGSDMMPPEDLIELDAHGVRVRGPAEPGAHDAVGVEQQGGRDLRDVEPVGEVGAPGQVDLDVSGPRHVVRDRAEQPSRRGALGAELGRELQERGRIPEPDVPELRGADPLARTGAGTPLARPPEQAGARRRRDER